MKTSAKRTRSRSASWSELTPEEKKARLGALIGKYKGVTGGTEEFLRNRHEETEREERKYQTRQR